MKTIVSIVFNNFRFDSRVLKECLSLTTNGYHVKVVALHENDLPLEEDIKGLKVHRIYLSSKKLPNCIFVQIIKYLELAYKIVKNHQKTDYIHCNDLEPLPIALFIKLISRNKVKVVYDAHELETEKVGLKGIIKVFSKITERVLIHHVDSVITVSEGIADDYARRYRISRPLIIYNCPYFKEIPRKPIFREKFQIRSDQVIFLYQGNLNLGRGIETLLKAFENMTRTDMVLVLMGYGNLVPKILDITRKCSNIFYYPPVSPEIVLQYTASADIGIVFTENTCLNHFYSLPNKFFEYAMAGLGLLVNNLPEMRSLVEKYQCGLIIKEESDEVVRETIEHLNREDLLRFSNNARSMARDFNWELQEETLLKIYRGLIF